MSFGGCMAASCYHIGPLETIPKSYEKFVSWVRRHGYTPGESCYERYVADYWTTSNSDFHVAELLVKINREGMEARAEEADVPKYAIRAFSTRKE